MEEVIEESRYRRGGRVEHGDIVVKRWFHVKESSMALSHEKS